MKKKIFNEKEHEPKCEYCIFGRKSPSEEKILCEKKGIIDGEKTCRKYKYDPLKRVPFKKPVIQKADPDDFRL